MTYSEAIEATVTREQAQREIQKHSEDEGKAKENWEAFIQDLGDRPTYSGEEVLGWLGY